MNVVPIAKPVNEALIRELECLLMDARAGEITSMTWACGWRDDQYSNGWSFRSNSNHLAMLGELEMLRAELVLNVQFARDDSLLKDLQ